MPVRLSPIRTFDYLITVMLKAFRTDLLKTYDLAHLKYIPKISTDECLQDFY